MTLRVGATRIGCDPGTATLAAAAPNRPAFLTLGLLLRDQDLSGIGATNCRLLLDPFVAIGTSVGANGTASMRFVLVDSLSTATVHFQWFVLEPANPLGVTSTRRLSVPLVR